MYGSNYYGQSYYGQGPAVGTTFILHSVAATVVAVATIASKLLINKTVSAVVVTVATINKMFIRSITATAVVMLATVVGSIFEGLNVRRTSTKFLTLQRSTKDVGGFDNETKDLSKSRTTRIITDY